MRGFTRPEQRAMLLLLFAFGIGSLVWLYRQSQPLPPVNPAETATFAEYDSLLRSEGSDTVRVSSSVTTRNYFAKSFQPPQSSPPLDLNTATEAELMRLPGIGPVMAKRIVEYRQRHGSFKHLPDLRKVKGIGAKTYAKLAPLLVVK